MNTGTATGKASRGVLGVFAGLDTNLRFPRQLEAVKTVKESGIDTVPPHNE